MVTLDDIGKRVIAEAGNGAQYGGMLTGITFYDEAIIKIDEIDLGYGWEAEGGIKTLPIKLVRLVE